MNKKNSLALNKKGKSIVNELQKEIDAEYLEKAKGRIKTTMKELRQAELIVVRLKKELKDLTSGKKIYTEEEMLLDDED